MTYVKHGSVETHHLQAVKQNVAALSSLTPRKHFLHAARSPYKWIARHVIVQFVPESARLQSALPSPPIRLGLTASKKLGKAVTCNRIRRQLREAFRLHLQTHALPPGDYVLIGRGSTYAASFATLQQDLAYCLRKLERKYQASEDVA